MIISDFNFKSQSVKSLLLQCNLKPRHKKSHQFQKKMLCNYVFYLTKAYYFQMMNSNLNANMLWTFLTTSTDSNRQLNLYFIANVKNILLLNNGMQSIGPKAGCSSFRLHLYTGCMVDNSQEKNLILFLKADHPRPLQTSSTDPHKQKIMRSFRYRHQA